MRNTVITCRLPTPTARSSPTSRVRSDTETSMTFMMPMPATESEIAAMAPTASVSTPRICEKVATTASWVSTVTSSSRWRWMNSLSTFCLTGSRAAVLRTWIMTRKRERRSNMRIAVATGTMAMSSRSMPSCWPRWARTPITRMRQPPMRTTWPTGSSARKSSRASLDPSTTTGRPRWMSSAGRKSPCPRVSLRTSRKSRLVPAMGTCRRRAPWATDSVPTTMGDIFSASGMTRRMVCASCRVMS